MTIKKPIPGYKVQYEKSHDRFSNFVLLRPFSVCLKITNKCNYSCPHCIANSHYKHPLGQNTQEIFAILDVISRAGIERIDITGGEPFLRPDIISILKYAHKIGLLPVVTSNGSCITEKHAIALKETQTYVQISIDGPKIINDQLRAKNSYANAIRAIKFLKKHEVPTRINCTVQRKNYSSTQQMIDLAKSLQVDSLYFIIISAQGRAYELKDQIALTPRQELTIRQTVAKFNDNNLYIKILDYKLFETACVLIDTNGNFISQRWNKEDTKIVGNVLKEDILHMWQGTGLFDHALHLMQYLQHPSLIK